MVEIDDKQQQTTEGILPGSGIVRRMVSSISNQIKSNEEEVEKKFKSNIKTNLYLSSTTKSVVTDFRKAIELHKLQKRTAAVEMPIQLPNNTKQSLITKLSANFTNENKNLNKYYETRPYQLQETVDGIAIQIKQPHLISVIVRNTESNETNQNLKTSIRIYPLKRGRTTLGSADSNDIVINGPGIEDEHCFIENNLINESNKANLVTLYPIGSLCSIDGVLIEKPFKLNSGNILCLGESDYFRYNQNLTEEQTTSGKEMNKDEISNSMLATIHTDMIKKQVEHEPNLMPDESNVETSEKNKDNSKSLNHELNDRFVKLSFKNEYENDLMRPKPNKDKRTVRFNLPINTNNQDDLDSNYSEQFNSNDISLNKKEEINHRSNAIITPKTLKGIIKLNNNHKQIEQQPVILNKLNRSPSKKFLSTINKFELLSRGIKVEESDDFDLNTQQTNKNPMTSIKMLCSTMPMNDPTDKSILYLREIKSKSFGCEKDLHNSSGNGSSSSSSSSSTSSTSSSSSSGMGRSWSTKFNKNKNNKIDTVNTKPNKTKRKKNKNKSKKNKNELEITAEIEQPAVQQIATISSTSLSIDLVADSSTKNEDTIPQAFHIDNLDFIDDDVSVSLVCCSTSKIESTVLTTSDQATTSSSPQVVTLDKENPINDLSDEDDYDDNVIYEGDSDSDNDEEDSQLIDDIYGDLHNDPITTSTTPISSSPATPATPAPLPDNEKEEDLSTKSAPVFKNLNTENLQLLQKQNEKMSTETVVNSFIYDVNLYTDKQNMLLNEQKDVSSSSDANNKSKLCNYDSNDEDVIVETYLSNSCNSSTCSLNYDIKLEPLVIEENKSLGSDTIDLKLEPTTNNQTLSNDKSNPQPTTTVVTNENTFSYSSLHSNSISSTTTNAANLAVVSEKTDETKSDLFTDSMFNNQALVETSTNTESNCFNKLDEAAASLNDRLRNETNYDSEDEDTEYQIKNDQQNSNEDDSLVDVDYSPSPQSKNDDSTESSTKIVNESQLVLKDNYEKAKRERQLEQEQAELEKKRLQEILDICMEFQRQEQFKSENNTQQNAANKTIFKQCQQLTNSKKLPNLGSLKQKNGLKNSLSQSSSLCSSSLSNSSSLEVGTSILAIKTDTKKGFASKDENANCLSPSSSSASTSSSSSINTNKLLNVINNDLLQQQQQKIDLINRQESSTSTGINPNLENAQDLLILKQNVHVNELDKHQIQLQIEKLNREKYAFITCLNYLKQKIQDIEMRQNEAIRDLEMERALLDVEHNNQLKNIQNDEAKLKHLQQEHQMRIDAFNMHTNQIRNEIEMVQMTIKNVENEILILDTNLDASNYQQTSSSCMDLDSLKLQKQRNLDESKRQHEDLEFQLMELEAKYESELEDIQNRLIKEQDNLLNAFKQRQVNLNDYDQQQTQMLMQVKAETECLEIERQKLIEQFKKQRNQLHQIEKKLNKMQEQFNQQQMDVLQTEVNNHQQQSPIKSETDDSVSSANQQSTQSSQMQNDAEVSPSPASSSVSLSSSLTNSASNTPPPPAVINTSTNGPVPVTNHQMKHMSPQHNYTPVQSLTPNRYIPPNTNPNRLNSYQNNYTQMQNLQQMQTQLLNSVSNNINSTNSLKSQQYKKQLSKSFRDILENTLLINGFNDVCLENNNNNNTTNSANIYPCSQTKTIRSANNPPKPCSQAQNTQRTHKINKSTSSLENSNMNLTVSNATYNNPSDKTNYSPSHNKSNKIPATPVVVNTQLIMKFAELERTLAMTKAENNNLLEQQLQARERELQLLQEEKNKREELERQLNEEIHLREKIVEENIKLRDKKQTQARPLTRYLPVRDNNFDLKQHVENSGHQLINQIDINTKQPLIQINSHSCRGYLLKMGQKFKTWNKRWFVFDRQKRTLCYYLDKHETKLRGSIYFQSINEVYVDHMRSIKSPDSKSTFVVKTFDRNFYFVAPSSELMRMWVDVIFTGAEGYLEFLN